jgi:high affinity Mn2+ porin
MKKKVHSLPLAVLSCLASAAAVAGPEDWALHGQATNVYQKNTSFRSHYHGQNSLDENGDNEETIDLTLYAGLRLAPGTQLWINPEIDQGFGLANTTGMGGYPSGEAYKVGANPPYVRIPRLFVRHVVPLGAASEEVEAGPNQLGGTYPTDNLTITAGKFSAPDVFDTNRYAHDARADFLNWSVIDSGAFDYAADPWGYTYGVAAEWAHGSQTVRAGVFALSPEPNGKIVAPHFGQYMLVGELEQRYQWHGHAGAVRLLGFANKARMGRYADAAALADEQGATPDLALVRRPGWRTGAVVNLEQELADGIGMFVRAGANDGSKEAYEFTEINRSLSAGLVVDGAGWTRPGDRIGIAGVVNQLSGDARAYFARGGIGILIGDGALSYGAEKIVEAYYSARLARWLSLSLDVQHVTNPAYNRSRGPVPIYGLRLHAQF